MKLSIYMMSKVFLTQTSLNLHLVLTYLYFIISIKTTIKNMKLNIYKYMMFEVFITDINLKLLIFIHVQVIWPNIC